MTIVNESKIGVLFASVLAAFGVIATRASTKDDNEVVTSSPE